MTKWLKAFAAGAGAAALSAGVGALTGSMTVFVMLMLAAVAVMTAPVVIRLFTSPGSAKPTVYGTSAPNSYSTISKSAESDGPKPFDGIPGILAIGALIVFGILLLTALIAPAVA
ncbi:hypothetical protein [Alkalicoccus luteus]|uniref:Uncharacterized protein n=1 Tax=Alkalicoccus luteus TaxID=1237094 RepID=A0A969TWZ3_9BACI|nr:hypothetical protein [Alkalicoccus luteus]NJP37749.1 hypothetical protein [Alkalicoccus luteus]